MTAINVIRQANSVHILSDGLYCNSDGIICEIGPNAFALPHLPAAVAIRGPTHFMPFLVHRLNRECGSFDDLLARIVSIALEVHISVPMTLGSGPVTPEFDLVAVGWSSQRSRPESFLITNQEFGDLDEKRKGAWKLIELPDVLIAPVVGVQQTRFLRWKIPDSAESFKPETDGVKLLMAQRLSKGLHQRYKDPKRDFESVGGFVHLTTVSANAVSSAVLHRWPDKPGQKVVPKT